MALYLLGSMRENGQGYDTDLKAAMTFYLRAAELNNGPAQEALARIYAHALLCVESHKWQILANEHGWRFEAVDYGAVRWLTPQQRMASEAAAAALRPKFDNL